MTLASFALRNVLRNRVRSILTIAAVAIAVLTVVFLQTAISAWSMGADRAPKNRLMTRNRVAYELGLPRHYVDTVRELPGVERVGWLNWFGGKEPNHPSQSMSTYACDPPSFLAIYDGISVAAADRDRWLGNRTGVLVGEALASRMGWKVGDRVVLSGTVYPGDWEFTIDAIYHPTGPVADPGLFLLHWDYLNSNPSSHMHDRVEYIWTKLRNASESASVSRAIDAIFEEKDVPTRTEDERAFFASMLGMVSAVLSALDFISLAVIAIMALLARNAIAMAVDERTSELVAMRAIGFGTGALSILVTLESVVIGALGGALGVIASYPLVNGLIGGWVEATLAALLPEFRISSPTVVKAFAVSLATSALVALFPVARVARITIADGLRRVT
jgi:putative ABC transport system permease protein